MTSNRWLDHTGLNLIRIVIGSYFMAIALGLIEGVEPSALFQPVMPAPLPDLAGTVLLFALSVAFMSGLWLRLTALSLALFVLTSSTVQNFLLSVPPATASFWRDLALVCAVIMCYSALHRRDMRQAAIILRRRLRHIRAGGSDRIVPRRIHGGRSPAARGEGSRSTMIRPMIAPPAPHAPRSGRQALAAGDPGRDEIVLAEETFSDDEITNIFAKL